MPEWITTLGFAMGSAWLSGINLYATVATLGLLQRFHLASLPGNLDFLSNWWVIGVAIGLYVIEFVADKVPYIDSLCICAVGFSQYDKSIGIDFFAQ